MEKLLLRISRFERELGPRLEPKITDSRSDFSRAAISSLLPGGGAGLLATGGGSLFVDRFGEGATGHVPAAGGDGGEGFDSLLHHRLQHGEHQERKANHGLHGGGCLLLVKEGLNGAGHLSSGHKQGFDRGGVKGGFIRTDEGGVVPTEVIDGISFRFTLSPGTFSTGTGSTAERTGIIKDITIRQKVRIHTSNRRTNGGSRRGGCGLVRHNYTRERHRFSKGRHDEYRGTLYSTVYLELQRA